LGVELIHTKTDPQRGLASLDRSCTSGNKDACFKAAFELEVGGGVPKDTARAREYYGKACKLGLTEVCPRAEKQ